MSPAFTGNFPPNRADPKQNTNWDLLWCRMVEEGRLRDCPELAEAAMRRNGGF